MRIPLEQLKVQKPCPKSWDELRGDHTRRYCGECGLHVQNLSAMTRGEVEAFASKASGRVCVAYVPDAQGSPSVLNYATNGKSRRWAWVWLGAIVAMLTAGLQAIAPGRATRVMGGIQAPPPTTTTGANGGLMAMGEMHVSPTTCPTTQPTQLGDVYIPEPTTKPSGKE